MSFFRRTGIVNVKMVITEEKILSNIDKIQKLINPNSKKQIVQLEDDSYFKDLVESIKTYLIEYPKKKNFPRSVYKASYDLVEFATNQFEENTKKIEELIRKREKNIKLANILRDSSKAIKAKAKNWKELIKRLDGKYPAEIIQALVTIGKSKDKEAENYLEACKTVDAKINNLESNLHIEIDMERIEDRSKALSYIGIEIAEALKYIPTPVYEMEMGIENQISEEVTKPKEKIAVSKSEIMSQVVAEETEVEDTYFEETRFEVKPSLWQRIKNSKFVKTISYIMKIRIVLDYPALPEGNSDNY